jgi:predicted unusual protein kinase regulating ubiquinone biosynthesis (AarF/ABC1/UbiB family)
MDNTKPIKRGQIATKAVIKVGLAHSKGFAKRVFGANKEDSNMKTHQESAKIIFEALSQLKGISVKVAQQVALAMPFLPQSYLDELSKTFHSIPPINKALIRKVIKQELGDYPENIFNSFDNVAFASASLGQVHKAIVNHESIAVKIQYPAINSTIAIDMKILSYGLKHFAKGGNIDHLIKEITDKLYEEVDYDNEANNVNYFREHIKNKQIIIPKVYENLSTKKVLALSFIDGLHFDSFMNTKPSIQAINHYAQLIFDTFFDSLYKCKAIHADPNPSNFLFIEDGKLAMIDFGCIKKVGDVFLQKYNELHLALIDGKDEEYIISKYVQLEMIDEGLMEDMVWFYQEVIKPLDSLYIEILINDTYDFGAHSDFTKRGFDAVMKVSQKKTHSIHKVNQEILFIDRTLLGYYAIFEKMGATIDTRKAKEIMRNFKGEKHE